jgi:hypothetical protein
MYQGALLWGMPGSLGITEAHWQKFLITSAMQGRK